MPRLPCINSIHNQNKLQNMTIQTIDELLKHELQIIEIELK